MSANTKILVLKRKKIIYSIIILGVVLFLLIYIVITASPDNQTTFSESLEGGENINLSQDISSEAEEVQSTAYIPGIYTTSLILGDQSVNIEVTVDRNGISSITLADLDETVQSLYPLLEPTLDSLCGQIYENQSLENITYDQESKYTSLVLLEAIKGSLEKASAE